MAVLLPEGSATFAMADTIFEQTEAACREVGVTLVGGHTEISVGFTRPIVVGTMVGEVERECLVTSSGARPGDRILLTKGIALEGTALLAREKEAELRRRGVAPSQIEAAKRLLRVPGIGVLREARVASRSGRPTAMHDPTEGGLSTGLYELAEASRVGIRLDLSAVPILPESRVLCEALGIDPLGLIASGALLLTVAPEEAGAILASMEQERIACQIIGEVTSPEEGVSVVEDRRRRLLPRFERVELARLFETPVT
jgi:hydrogenase maturation factor